MDSLHVSSQNQQSNSRNISRSVSPCRSTDQPMPSDRNPTPVETVSNSIRFRQSPSSNRKSREREKSEKELMTLATTARERDRDMIDHVDNFDDSRLLGSANDDLGCSYNLEDNEGGQGGNTSQIDGNEQRSARSRTNSCQVLDRLSTKIACTKESIRKEQTARDDNVNEYLKLAASADKQQLQRIKAVFEKKNQKSAHNISQLQKKLESYSKRLKDLQLQQNMKQTHRQPREMLRDVGQGLRNVGGNIRDGVTTSVATVMSKPREFAHLIKNKFGSADNINQLSSNPDLNELNLTSTSHGEGATHGSATHTHHYHHHGAGGAMTPNNSGTMTSVGSSGNAHPPGAAGGGGSSGKFNSEQDSECSSVTSESMPGGSGKNQSLIGGRRMRGEFKLMKTELTERKEDCEKLKEKVARLEAQQKEITDLAVQLESERYRAERLEEQINDLTELHQNEIENLKQNIADMEEKVQYQSDERLRDVNDVLENCQTRISKMEHLSQQQFTNLDGIDNGRELVVKLINVVLTVLQVILLVVATAAGIIMPFLKTRVRVLTTIFTILFIIFIIRQWPDVREIGTSIGSHMARHLKETLLVK